MNRSLNIVKIAFVLLIGITVFAIAGSEAMASHFRYGTISWRPTGTLRQVEFRIKVSYRRNATTALNGPIGGTFTADILDFGDGSATTNPVYTITSFSDADNYTIGEATLTHTYPSSPATFLAFDTNCCRISNLNNSHDEQYRLETLVTPGGTNSSPVTSLPPIITVGASTASRFVVPASDVDRDTIRFRLATVAEQGALTNTQPPNFSVNSTTGEVTWNTATLNQTNFWTAQIVIEDLDTAGNVKSKTPVDFLLKIQNSVGTPPTIAINPPGPLSVRPNTLVTFTVTGRDTDPNARVTLNASGLPTGSTMNPALGSALTPPVTSTFTWTPTTAQAGSYTITFTATDDTFQQTAASINIFVEPNLPPTIACPQPTTTPATSAAGASVPLSVQVQDPNGDALTVTWNVDGANVQTTNVPASMSATTVPLTRTYAVGTHNITVTVSDGQAALVSCTTTVTVTVLSISVQVKDGSNNGISGVTLSLTGSATDTKTTDASGNYTFTNLTSGNYTVTASKTGLNFAPLSRIFNNMTANQTANFTGTPITLTISGRVVDGSNNGISGVTMSLSGSTTPPKITDASGNYSFTGLTFGGNYTVTPSKTGLSFTPPSQTFSNITANQTADFSATPIVSITGRVTSSSNTGIAGVNVTLSGALTRVGQTDANGAYSFNNLVGGKDYSVVASSPFFVFNPPRFDFTNLTANQIANFVQVPNAVPTPTPPPSDDFNAAGRDSQKWNLGTATQPAGAFDSQVNVTQGGGHLVITPRSNVSGPHYNGYVSVNAFNMTGGKASVQVFQPASGGADTIFGLSSDADNFARFIVHTRGAPSSLAPITRERDGIARPLDVTMDQLIFQVKIAGQLQPDPPASIPYDPAQHQFLRFRHEPSTNSIVFETSPNNINFTVPCSVASQCRVFLQLGVSALTAELSAGTSSSTTAGSANLGPFSLVTSTIQFSASSYSVGEGDGRVNLTVKRSGDTSGAATVNFATSDAAGSQNCSVFNGKASSQCDYISTIGNLSFAAGEAEKTISVLIVDDSYAEGPETFNVSLGTPQGAGFGAPAIAAVTIIDNDLVSGANPIDLSGFFVTQHYFDFFSRQPDPAGLAFWTNQITSCGTDQACVAAKRINASAAFFISIEFQNTGYLVERIYKAAYGDGNGASTLNGAHQLPVPVVRFNEFLPDTQQIGLGVIVGQPGYETVLENNKQAFTAEFVQRARFTTANPTTLTPTQFVDKLFTNAGVTPSTNDRNAAIAEFGTATNTTDMAARARALRRVAENSILNTQEFNRAFVLMQFFGYLRRNPNDAPDADYTGYDFWLTKLNQFNGNFVAAEMVKAFINSTEYRQRFGQ